MKERSSLSLRVAYRAPIVKWLASYDTSWLRADILAGLTLWGMIVPEGIAYAAMAGAPHQAGLYTLLASLTAYAVFGTSRQLVSAATSSASIMTAAVIAPLVTADPSRFTHLLMVLVILVGVIFIISGLLRLGFIANFISEPVMTGFVFGMAIFIAVSQVPKVVGIDKVHGDVFLQFAHILEKVEHWNLTALALGCGALLLMGLIERAAPGIPSALVALVAGIVVVWGFDLDTRYGVHIVGSLPEGLPTPELPSFTLRELRDLIPGALAVALVALSQSMGTAETFAAEHGYEVDADRELFAMGVGNLGAGFLGGLVAGGSMSSTAVNDHAGARTQVSALVAVVLVIGTLIALTPVFYSLPEAVLGAIVIHAVLRLMKIRQMRSFYKCHRGEFFLAMVALLGVVVINLLSGLLLGVLLSLFRVIWRSGHLHVSVLGRLPGRNELYTSIDRIPECKQIPGLIILRLDGPVFFVNSGQLLDEMQAVIDREEPVNAILLDLGSNTEMDMTSVDVIASVMEEARAKGIEMGFANLSESVKMTFRCCGLMETLGEERAHFTVHDGVEDYLGRNPRVDA